MFKSTSLEKNETLETCRAPRIPEKSGEAIELELLKQTDYHGYLFKADCNNSEVFSFSGLPVCFK